MIFDNPTAFVGTIQTGGDNKTQAFESENKDKQPKQANDPPILRKRAADPRQSSLQDTAAGQLSWRQHGLQQRDHQRKADAFQDRGEKQQQKQRAGQIPMATQGKAQQLQQRAPIPTAICLGIQMDTFSGAISQLVAAACLIHVFRFDFAE